MPAHKPLPIRHAPCPEHHNKGGFLPMFALVNSSHLTILMVLFGLAWIGHLSSVALTAPMDNVEQWVWSQSLQWGYHKHPPLPTWLLALPQMLARNSGTDEAPFFLLRSPLTNCCARAHRLRDVVCGHGRHSRLRHVRCHQARVVRLLQFVAF